MIKDLTSGKSEDLWFGVINQYEIKAGRTSDWRPKNSVLLGENNDNAPQKYWSPASSEQNHNGFQRFQTSAVCKITHNTQIKGFQGNFFIIIWKYHNNLFFFFSLQNSFLPMTKRNCRTAYWVGREWCFSLPLKGTTYWSDDSEVSWLHQGSWLCGGREKEKKGGKIIQKMLHRKHFSWLILMLFIWKQQLSSAK